MAPMIGLIVFLFCYFLLLDRFTTWLFKWNLNRELANMEKRHE